MELYVFKDKDNKTYVSVIPPIGVDNYEVIQVENINDVVIDADGNVYIKTEAEKVTEKKQSYLSKLSNDMSKWVYTYYPQVKQNSDLSDYLTYTTLLRSMSISEAELSAKMTQIGAAIVNFSLTAVSSYTSTDELNKVGVDYFNQLVNELVASYTAYPANALIQLTKIAARVSQVNVVKSIYASTVAKLQSATTLQELDDIYNNAIKSYVWIQV
jgi:hypothetical protein